MHGRAVQHQFTTLAYSGRKLACSQLNARIYPPAQLPLNAEAGFSDYSKLSSAPPVDAVFLLDPLVATGGTACAALSMLLDWGIPGE
jgi:hypothetical protein